MKDTSSKLINNANLPVHYDFFPRMHHSTADRTGPRWCLLVQFEKGDSVETLQVVAVGRSARNVDSLESKLHVKIDIVQMSNS